MKSALIKLAAISAIVLAPTASTFAAENVITSNSAGLMEKLPATQLASKLGDGSASLINSAVSGSDTIYVISVGDVYSATDSNLINKATMGIDTYQIEQLQADISSDASAAALLSAYGVDASDVVSVVKHNGSLDIYVGA